MASDQDIGKKEIETNDLIPFLEPREFVTGETLSPIFGLRSENPDFVCVRPDGGLMGIELTRVTENRDLAFLERLRFGKVRIDSYKTQVTRGRE